MSYATPHYPTRYIDVHRLSDGRRITLRPILPQDAQPSQDFVRALSQRSRYRRFHGALTELTPAMLQHLTEVDYVRHLALVAETFEAGATLLVGEVRFVRTDDPGSAEFAVAVSDAWQGLGIGSLLLRALLHAARTAGLHRLYGQVLADNRPMLALARRMGFARRPHPADPELVEVSADPRRAAAAAKPPDDTPWSWIGRLARHLPPPRAAWRQHDAPSRLG